MAETIPIFPLSTVLLPGIGLSLHIFEPRYRQLITELAGGTIPGKSFGVVATKQGWQTEVDQLDHLYSVGCTAKLRDVERLADGRFDITTIGDRRFRLLELSAVDAPYLVGTVDWLPDISAQGADGDSVRDLKEAAHRAYQRYYEVAWYRSGSFQPDPETGIDILAHLIASNCLLPLDDRQQLLEETNPLCRLSLVRRMLNRETGILSALRAVPASLSDYGQRPSRN